MSNKPQKAPFPYYGGKGTVRHQVWNHYGSVRTFVEPFAGSLGILLGRPKDTFNWKGNPMREIVNDLNGFVVNAWRAIQLDPDKLALFIETNCPVFESDLRARQHYLVREQDDLTKMLISDPEAYDLEAAAYWISGISSYIGHGFPYDDGGRPHVSSYGKGVHSLGRRDRLDDIFAALSQRLRYVKIFCGDWSRCVTSQITEHGLGPAAIFLDPPYTAEAGRTSDLYDDDDLTVGHEVYRWCMDNGDDPNLRIALCGLEGEYDMPSDWKEVPWGGPGNFSTASRERIWFSPHCLDPTKKDKGILTTFTSQEDD